MKYNKENQIETRIVKLLKILIKIGIMFLVIIGLILINKKYMSNADGSEREDQKTLLERVVKPRPIMRV